MSKAILVIDMPTSCKEEECPLCVEAYSAIPYCWATKEDVENERPDWCPLRPMPMKRDTLINWYAIGGDNIPTREPSQYDMGWNDCVDFLESEDER